MVVIHHGIENQKETAHGLIAPHWIVGKENDVPLAVWHIYHSWLLRYLIAASNHSAQQQFFLCRKTEHHARLLVFGWKRPARSFSQVFRNIELLLARAA